MTSIILAAGVGSRLGNPYPKCLSKLPDGQTILSRQMSILQDNGIKDIVIVVGFKMSLIMEHIPQAVFKYNPAYYITNTSKSLLKGLENVHDDTVWMNADVIFDPQVIERIVQAEGNTIVVNQEKCGEEEIKYTLDSSGAIQEISKTAANAKGEAVGVNKISASDLEAFKKCLASCDDNDYFERAIEIGVNQGLRFTPVDISDIRCIEIDMKEDFDRAMDLFF
ncbi:MAG: phosphocholine cytidylyltransferase family protein [Candidatus Omnitrophica bacterium]|nr:phosphocholine cytidylyltransferase family protein [Candidatus Omnitrophota bacterium]